jgi:NAD(P)-dependent dehydrogenase (short-subunit alcohol dehydrogenase family)
MELKDKAAVITGGGRGIGRAIALALAREGADILVAARTAEEIEGVAAEVRDLGCKGVAVAADLSGQSMIASFVEQVFSHFPTVDILVNNAGIGSSQNPKQVMEFDDEFWNTSLFVNLTVPYLLSKAFLPKMAAQGWGRIINISSVAGKKGVPFGASYSASKHGLIGLTRSTALEVAANGVTVNAICPGPIRTKMLAKRMEFDAQRLGITVAEVEKSFNPIQRLLDPDEVAGVAVYLASEKAQSMTGQAINICGGSTMH